MKINKMFFLLLCGAHTFSQNFISTGKIEYEMMVYSETSYDKYAATLLFNDSFSRFDYHTKDIGDVVNENKVSDNSTSINIKKSDTTSYAIFNDLKKAILYNIAGNEIVYENDTKQDWELVNEEKKIGNLVCFKATCDFRGRSYIAWYASTVPISFGPWKFKGLPGLIIELADSKNEVIFSVTKIEIPFKSEVKGLDLKKQAISREEAKKRVTEALAKQKAKAEEKARIMESMVAKGETMKINVAMPVLKKGIELD
jgi:GLPGLI family protein